MAGAGTSGSGSNKYSIEVLSLKLIQNNTPRSQAGVVLVNMVKAIIPALTGTDEIQ